MHTGVVPLFVRRFRRNARLVAIIFLIVLAALVATGAMLVGGADATAGFVLWAVALAMAAAAVAVVLTSRSRLQALRRVESLNPDGAVFLARRQPALVSDLATYVNDPTIYDEVADRWVVASIDSRGMSAWSLGPDSRELVIMPWSVVGSIETTPLENGGPGVAVDVKPFPEPLVVSVGYAAAGIMSSFNRQNVAEVVKAANALRPDTPPAG
jgi:hypothetical protein